MPIKTRNELKSYFVKNAIPTEGNFADLIDSMFVQTQDGVYKSETQPMSLVAGPGDQKRVLRLYGALGQTNPDWTVALQPTPATPGLGIADATGATRLFVHATNGNVGIGTTTPQHDLTVAGSVGVAGAIVPSVGNAENRGIQFPGDPGGGGGDRAFIRYFVEAGERTKLLIGNNNDPDDRISFLQGNGERLTIYNGKVGINQVTPTHALHVHGDAFIDGPLYFVPSTDPNYKIEKFAWPGSAAIRVKGWGAVALATSEGDVLTANGRAVDLAATSDGTNAAVLNMRNKSTNKFWHVTVRANEADQLIFWRNDTAAWVDVLRLHMEGHIQARHGALIRDIGVGTAVHGAVDFPHETIQMHPGHNLRVCFGRTQRLVLTNSGFLQVTGTGGEIAYMGGDGAGNDVQIGSMTNGIQNLAAYSTVHGYMHFYCRQLHQTSDERLKANIEPVTGALDTVLRLRAVRFDWKEQAKSEGPPRNLGVVAQEVRTVLPEAVVEGRDGALAVTYEALAAVLIEAVKEQQKQIDQLRAAVNDMRAPMKKGK